MISLLLSILLLQQSPSCEAVGELYRMAAEMRTKKTLEQALVGITDPLLAKTFEHVYARLDLSPRDLKFYMAGVCMGSSPQDPTIRRDEERPA